MKWFIILLLIPMTMQGQCRRVVRIDSSNAKVDFVYPNHEYTRYKDTVVVLKPSTIRRTSGIMTWADSTWRSDTTTVEVLEVFLKITNTRKCKYCEEKIRTTKVQATGKYVPLYLMEEK